MAFLWGDGYGPIDFPLDRLARDERAGPRQALAMKCVLKCDGGVAEVQGRDPNQRPRTSYLGFAVLRSLGSFSRCGGSTE